MMMTPTYEKRLDLWPDWLVIMPDDLAELTACLRENEQPIWPASDAV